MTETDDQDKRAGQVAVAAAILVGLGVVVCGVLVGWHHLPGLWGEWIGTMVGMMTTPFLLEASFIFIGMTIVLTVNYWRRSRDGDELVYMDRVDEAGLVLPDHAKWAVYREKPLPGEQPSVLAQAEGAVAIGDYEAAAEWFGVMSEAELRQPEALVLRLELAKATGREDLVDHLERELESARNQVG